MKTTAALFLFTLLAAVVTVVGAAEERLIPFDEFYISVPVTGAPEAGGKRPGLRVTVKVLRGVHEPQGGAGIEVSCPGFDYPDRSLEPDEVAALMEACAAASSGGDFRKEVRRDRSCRTVFEVVTVDGHRRVNLQRGNEVLLAPEEAARLKEPLAQAAAAEAWYKMLLTERTLPEKTVAAHPPKAADYFLISKLGGVRAEGLDYEVSLTHFSLNQPRPYQVEHGLQFFRLGGNQSSTSGEWVKRMLAQVALAQVALALQAVGKKEAFKFESPPDAADEKFSVTANLETQQADVTFDPGSFFGKHSPVQGSFGVKQLAEIREIAAQGAAREKWFAEHEGWFFEKE